MTALDEAYNRLSWVEGRLRATGAFTASLLVSYGHAPSLVDAISAFCSDLREVLGGVEERDEYREIIHDLVTDESERRAIGGGPGWKERHEKTWARAMELFEP